MDTSASCSSAWNRACSAHAALLPTALARWSALALLALGLPLVACDSNGGGPAESDLEGTFVFTRIEFTVAGVNNFDVLADTLVATDTSPRMEFFSGNATANLVFRLEGNPGTSFLPGQFRTDDGRVTVDFSGASAEDRFQLLLPPVVQFELSNNGTVLQADQEYRDVNLREYAPERYAGLTQNVNGTLQLRLERLASSP